MDYEMIHSEYGILHINEGMWMKGYVDESTLLLLSKSDVMLKALKDVRNALEQNCDCAYIYDIINRAVRESTSFLG